MKLSVVILTKNNPDTIRRTLKSVLWGDEIVIIDDYSSDDTLSIIKKYNVRVFQRHIDDDFALQRNFGLEKATYGWVLFIDSDEVVTEALQQEIREIISRKGTGGEGTAGYYIKRNDIFLGHMLQHGETAHVKLLRLAKKNAGKWIRPVHEYWDITGQTNTLRNPLLHYAHTNVAQFISDMNRYTTVNSNYLLKKGIHTDVLQIILYPSLKFIQNYFLRLGILDGTPGFIMAVMMSFHSYLTRAKLYILTHKK